MLTKDIAVDVNIYASHPSHAPGLVGNHENTDVGKFIASYLDLDLDVVTKELKSKSVDTSPEGDLKAAVVPEGQGYGEWMGPESLSGKEEFEGDRLVTLDAYHGDFKHRKREEADCGCGLRH